MYACVCVTIVTCGDFDCCYFRCICRCYSLPTSPPMAAPSSLRDCSLRWTGWCDQTRGGLLIAAILSVSVGCLLRTIRNQKQINNTSASAFLYGTILVAFLINSLTQQLKNGSPTSTIRWHNLESSQHCGCFVLVLLNHLNTFPILPHFNRKKNAWKTHTHSLTCIDHISR